MATYAGQLIVNGETLLVGSTLYGVCETAASTNDKSVTITGFDRIITGVTIHVKMANGNSATRPTLNVMGTGAWPIRKADGEYGIQSDPAGAVHALTYDGGAWVVNT